MSILEPDGGRTPIDPGRSPSEPSTTLRAIPALRLVGPGETRVLGTFVGVDCGRDRIVLQVTTDGRTMHLTARSFDDVEFISYVDNAPTSIPCGLFGTASRVLATYRPLPTPADGIDGQSVAIELIPANYTPR
jgi:hypothetical protein